MRADRGAQAGGVLLERGDFTLAERRAVKLGLIAQPHEQRIAGNTAGKSGIVM